MTTKQFGGRTSRLVAPPHSALVRRPARASPGREDVPRRIIDGLLLLVD